MKIAKILLSILCAVAFLLIVIGAFVPITTITVSSSEFSANVLYLVPSLTMLMLAFAVFGFIMLLERTKYFSIACIGVCFIINVALIYSFNLNADMSPTAESFDLGYLMLVTVFSALIMVFGIVFGIIEQCSANKNSSQNETAITKEQHTTPIDAPNHSVSLLTTRLEYLNTLHDKGILTDAELAEKRKAVIDSFNL